MQDYLLFGHIYIPAFMVNVIFGLFLLFTIKYVTRDILIKLNVVNPSLCQLCLVLLITGQLLLLQISG
ncbi:hypothetical protein VIN01S_18140 [Vibrio inusitatus NBRC 102082]|uniref:DUF1656 domain-containing protein n=1 Tax=Vibrio inusitatus NBRC 102082 TaxID=1219070 RepID=A0A4Y3HWB7_9VIBR|nr:hypothetical protein VIN01S_18140 [Vibrio inusitatus NBRC 102082]